MPFAPIALFVYNRPSHTLQVLAALALNHIADQSDLYIFSDGAKRDATEEDLAKIQSVREVIRQRQWCRKVHIIERSTNLGLDQSVISGITTVLNHHTCVIVLEDDIVPSPFFLSFMNEALDLYEKEEQVLSISSFNFFALSNRIPEVFFSQLIDCWGWATWRRGWALFEPDSAKLLEELDRQQAHDRFNVGGAYDYYGMLKKTSMNEVNPWDIRWYASGFIHNKLSVYPKISLSRNIGFDGTGVNSGHHVYSDGRFDWPDRAPSLAGRPIENNQDALREFYEYFHPSPSRSLKNPLNKLLRLFHEDQHYQITSFAPVALFVYNRPSHVLRVLEALASNTVAHQTELYIFSDGPKPDASDEVIANIEAVRKIIRKQKWCKRVYIVERPANLGLAQSVISGISGILKNHPRVIVLEDDIVPSPVFLSFMNEALDFYEREDQVISISSFNFFARSKSIPDIFFSQLIDCWGWATWRRGWDLFEPDAAKLLAEIDRQDARVRFNVDEAYDYYGMLEKTNKNEIDSWAIRWYASGFIHNKLTVYPKISVSRNIGFDGTGVNSGRYRYNDGRLDLPKRYPSLSRRTIANNQDALHEFYDYFHPKQKWRVKWMNKLFGLFS